MIRILILFLFTLSNQSPHQAFANQALNKEKASLLNEVNALVIKKNRLKATNLINKRLEDKTLNKEKKKNLIKVLGKISNIFLTEHSQKQYERAKSFLKTDIKQAHNLLLNALSEEKNNIILLKALIYTSIKQAQCSQAQGFVTSGESINPYDEELKVLKIKTLSCSKKFLKEEFGLSDFEKPEWIIEFAKHDLINKDLVGAKVTLEKIVKLFPEYPETYYWLYKLNKKPSHLDDYIAKCKSANVFNYFPKEPFLCIYLSEVEKEKEKRESK